MKFLVRAKAWAEGNGKSGTQRQMSKMKTGKRMNEGGWVTETESEKEREKQTQKEGDSQGKGGRKQNLLRNIKAGRKRGQDGK